MDTAVVELDSLTDAVGAAAEDHHFVGVGGHRHRVRGVVAGIVVGGVFHPAHRHRVPPFDDAGLGAPLADGTFLQAENLGQVQIRKPLLLGSPQQLDGQLPAPVGENFLLAGHQLAHLFKEPAVDRGPSVQFLHGRPFAQGLVEHELALAGRHGQAGHEVLKGQAVEMLVKPQTAATGLQSANRLLKGLLVGLTQTHHLAHGPHLGAKLVLHPTEFLKGPAGELDHHILAGRGIAVQTAVAPVSHVLQGLAAGQTRRHQSNGKPRGLGGQRRTARGARVDLDHHHPVCDRIVGELDVGAADHPDRLDYGVGRPLQPLLQFDRHG